MKQDNLSAEMMSGGFFSDFGRAVTKGDLFVKLSMLWMGAGYAKRKQYIKAALMTLFEIAVIVFYSMAAVTPSTSASSDVWMAAGSFLSKAPWAMISPKDCT